MANTIFNYNGYAFPHQLDKVRFSRSAQEVVISTAMTVPTATVDSVMATLNAWDKVLSLTWANAGANNETWNVATNAVSIRTLCAKDGSFFDGGVRQRIVFTARIRLKDIKAGDSGFEQYEINAETDPQGGRILAVTGTVTGTSGGNTAVENFDAGIAAIEAIAVALYPGTYNKPQRNTPNNDRHNNVLAFRSVQVEELETVNYLTAGGAEDHNPLIMFYRWNMVEETNHDQGHSDPREKVITVDFGCVFDRTYASGPAELKEGIAALVMKRLASQFGYSDVILLREGRGFSSTEMNASGQWIFRANQGDVFTSYSEIISDFTDFGGYRKIQDGQDLTIKMFSPGAIMELTQTVTATSQGTPPSDPPVPAIAVNGVSNAQLFVLSRGRDRGSSQIGDDSFGTGGTFSTKTDDHTFTFTRRYVVGEGEGVTTGR